MAINFKLVSQELLKMKHQALHSGKYTDCTFVVGKDINSRETLNATKSELMIASPVFEAMFNSPLQTSSTITITDSSPTAFSHFLDFLHLAQFINPITFDDAVEVLVLSDKYLINPLRDHCINIIEKQMNESKIWTYLNSHMPFTINHVQAEKACMKLLTTETYKCIEHPSFLEASQTSIIFMLKQNKLNVSSEKLLFDRCCQWALKQGDQRKYMRKLLPYLRLRTLTQEQVSLLPEECIDPLEKLELLKDVCNTSLKRKAEVLSKPFSNSMKKRTQMYIGLKCNVIPFKMISCPVEDLAFKDKHKAHCKSVVNYLDLLLKKEIFMTEIELLGRIEDLSRIEYHPNIEVYQNVPKEKCYNAQLSVKCQSFEEYNLKRGNIVTYNSTVKGIFTQPVAIPKNSVFTLCVTVKTDQGNSYYRKVDADVLNEELDAFCKTSEVFESIRVRVDRSSPVFIKCFNFTK